MNIDGDHRQSNLTSNNVQVRTISQTNDFSTSMTKIARILIRDLTGLKASLSYIREDPWGILSSGTMMKSSQYIMILR